ncbi:hypothetical protein [Leuconostoc mesenteroides]|nr:hypothetical protein [Leuconostoc mesenteroides]
MTIEEYKRQSIKRINKQAAVSGGLQIVLIHVHNPNGNVHQNASAD